MRIWVFVAALLAAVGFSVAARAQDKAWVQVEAHPSQAEAIDRAEAYAAAFPDVTAYATRTGWIAIVLGPYAPAAAAGRLNDLKRENMIPADSYIVDGSAFGDVVWPVGGVAPAPAADVPVVQPEEPLAPVVVEEPDETPQQARASEAALSDDDRIALQRALAWYGFYQGALDGAFGKGTRGSMAAWQEANGFEATGILTARQRAVLVTNYQADQAEFGFQTITEAEAGIEITLPLSLVAFEGYEPPFVRFAEKDGSGVQIMLISEPGGAEALAGLYDILQTLAVVPAEGERSRSEDSFTINAGNAEVQSFAYAEQARGMVKGYLVVWKPADAERMARVLPALKASFRPVGSKALDPGLVPMEDAVRAGLLAGLEVRRPKLSRTGFFADPAGTVVTVAEAVAQCSRITLDHDTEAQVLTVDAAAGVAVLKPAVALAPPAVAALSAATPRAGTEIAVAGYSYEDKLPAPVLTFGAFEEARGLNGEAGIARLSAPVLPGDAGGPVIDPTGAVVGMLLPAGGPDGKALPAGVAFALSADSLDAVLTGAGITPALAPAGAGRASPDALNKAALGMTVLVSCWE